MVGRDDGFRVLAVWPEAEGRRVGESGPDLSGLTVRLVGRLASLVPAARTNTVVYHGVLAANAHLRSRVVASARGPRREPTGEEGEIRLSRPDRLARGRSRWTPWADLLHRFSRDACRFAMDTSFQELLTRTQRFSNGFHILREGVEKAIDIAERDPEIQAGLQLLVARRPLLPKVRLGALEAREPAVRGERCVP